MQLVHITVVHRAQQQFSPAFEFRSLTVLPFSLTIADKFIRISATEVQLGEPAERLVGGVVVRLQGNKAVIPLAAIDMDFDGRGHMTYLFQKVKCANWQGAVAKL